MPIGNNRDSENTSLDKGSLEIVDILQLRKRPFSIKDLVIAYRYARMLLVGLADTGIASN